MTNFIDSADSRETDVEIMKAILSVANNDEAIAEKVWEAPSQEQLNKIIVIVTKDGAEASDYFWGASGTSWAK